MALRKIELTVGGTEVGRAKTWSYPSDDGKHYSIPTYNLEVRGTDARRATVTKTFEVIRFGVHRKTPAESTRVVGLADHQRYVIRGWLPDYSVHSAASPEMGAWHVFDNYLIHDGPDDPHNEAYATAGCIEICGGPAGFDRFNDLLITLSGSMKTTRGEKLHELGRAGTMSITYLRAGRPPLVEWRG
ncbi:hypothetical protein [Chondromyces crocatus]|uniref:Uncharacterized protein n=1 Tax=Chondromyces crocatus TaxID=52 RepID=A0A0K1ECU6_CHOCO|nr:hypothetical protein [Chondromyces crocatus]AKT38690.1 uncharacterized protein CMC5_028380 [Chondromyces crocatus]